MSLSILIVTLQPWERYLNWVPDPAPPPTRYHGDLTSPAPSEDQENTLPQDASRKLPRRSRPRRRKEKQPGSSTNGNSASRTAGSVTQLGSPANRNSALSGSSAATRLRSAANENSPLPGNRPGTSRSSRSTPVEHPRIRRKQRFVPAVGSCTNSTRSHLVSAMLPLPSPASWIASSLVSTGKCASFILTTLSSSLPHGRNISLGSVKSSRD